MIYIFQNPLKLSDFQNVIYKHLIIVLCIYNLFIHWLEWPDWAIWLGYCALAVGSTGILGCFEGLLWHLGAGGELN